MKKLVVIHYEDINYDIGGLVRFLVKIFNTDKYKQILLEKYNFEVITSLNIVKDIKKTELEYIDYIKNDANFKDAVLFGIHPHGLSYLYKIFPHIKTAKNIKTVGWINDPHFFAYYVQERKNKNISVQNYTEKYDPIYVDNLDYLLSPSLIYFKNLNITKHDSKLIDMFYFLNPELFNENFSAYSQRKNEIILSGSIEDGYESRVLFKQLKTNLREFNNLIYVLPCPGYKNNAHMTELNYYKKLAEFKGAFVGHYKFPLNYLLAKHIEVLMCGCLGFFEPNPLLESQLGLKEFVHYIPCYSNEKLIENSNFYTEWLENGETIAKQGQQHIMENFGEKQIHKLFSFLSNV